MDKTKKQESKIEPATPESIKSSIVKVRGRCVIIDSDLAGMYGVETKNLKRTVRMNIERFPKDFMFVLTKEEYDSLRCNFFTLKNGRGQHSKYLPYAFTREGIAMLSGLLMTPIAIQVNINIMRAFFQMQQSLLTLSETNCRWKRYVLRLSDSGPKCTKRYVIKMTSTKWSQKSKTLFRLK